jgi:HK97 family phage major capsid protein
MTNAILSKVEEIGDAFVKAREAHEKQLAEVVSRVETIEALRDRPRGPGSNAIAAAYELIDAQGKRYPALSNKASFAEYVRRTSPGAPEDADFSLGGFVRGAMTGTKVASGAMLVPVGVSSQIIDAVRAQTALIKAGAATIPISGPTNFCRVASDPTIYEHVEAAVDVSESSPTFEAVSANPKTLVALVPLSMEVVQDSPNLDAALRMSIAAAMGLKLDQLGLAVILADANVPDSAAAHDPSLWGTATTGTLGAVAAAMALNQSVPAAAIVHPTNYVARHASLASTAGSWLGAPPLLSNMLEVPTTSMTLDISVLGGFERGVGIVMRQDLSLEIVRYGKPTAASHLLVATMRGAAIVTQPLSIFIQRKVP